MNVISTSLLTGNMYTNGNLGVLFTAWLVVVKPYGWTYSQLYLPPFKECATGSSDNQTGIVNIWCTGSRKKTQEMMKCSGRPPGIIHRVNTNYPQSKLIIYCTYCIVVEYHYGSSLWHCWLCLYVDIMQLKYHTLPLPEHFENVVLELSLLIKHSSTCLEGTTPSRFMDPLSHEMLPQASRFDFKQ